MKQIPYSDQKTSKLFHEIKSHIESFDTTIEIDLTDTHKDVDGYQGNFVVEVNEDADFFLVEDFNNKDISRFPARIKAAATALKFSGYMGKFSVSHKQGILRIVKIDSEIINQEMKRRITLWKKINVSCPTHAHHSKC